jgi:hypothetical protein
MENNKFVEIEKPNVYQRLSMVRKIADFIQKEDLRTEETIKAGSKGLGFKAVSSAMVLLKVNKAINDVGLVLITELKDKKVWSEKMVNSYNKEVTHYFADIETEMSWVNIDNPEDKVIIKWSGFASNPNPAQVIGSALTYAEKYFILKEFNIPTDNDDPDVIVNNDHNTYTPKTDKNNTDKKPEVKKWEKPKTKEETEKNALPDPNPDESLKKNVEKYFNLAKDFDSLQNTVAGYLKKYPNLVNSEWFESLHQKRLNELKASEEAIQDLSKAGN